VSADKSEYGIPAKNSSRAIRQRAEDISLLDEVKALQQLSPEETHQLIHELRVHQIELEMQSEELRHLQHNLEASQHRYFSLYDQAPVGYLTINEQGLIQEANITAATMFGTAQNDLLKRPITQFIFREDQTVYYLQRNKISEKNEVQAWDMRLLRADGSLFWAHLKATPVINGEYLVTFSDITERKRSEEEKALLESQLHQAQKMESVGRLAGGVAHDFNNLLTVILGGAYLALDELEPSQPLYEYVTQIKNAGEKSANLTQQLLAFARKQTISPMVLDLNETVASMLKMLQRLIGEDIQLTWQPETKLWLVKADPSQIDQILANLCVNARDSIADIGNINIQTGNSVVDEEYCVEHSDVAPGEYVHISVCDNGCGMDKETMTHIFEPFFTTKGIGEGTGLGLATVYGAAKQNNGFVNVYSEPAIGTTFTIYLPRYVGNNDQKLVKDQAEESPRGLETILLVEDEPAILNMVAMLLKKQGYTVIAANTPGEAVRLANEHSDKIDLLITDVVMPEMNGRDLAHNLISLSPTLKCLFMSGYTTDVIAHHGVLDEGMHFIHKPFALPDLAIKVRKVLDVK